MNNAEQQFLNELDNKFWKAADKLRANMDAANYKHVVLGLIFLKYVSDAFEARQQELITLFRDVGNPDNIYAMSRDGYDSDEEYAQAIVDELEVEDYYTEKNIFWVPKAARWDTLKNKAMLPTGTVLWVDETTGKDVTLRSVSWLVDNALDEIEKTNPKLKGILNRISQYQLGNEVLTGLINTFSDANFSNPEYNGEKLNLKSKDILGHVYEYFLGQFALAEGKQGGQYYTPKSIVTLIVECLQPYNGRVYDPAMGSGGFFVSSDRFIEEHAGEKQYNAAEQKQKISVYGQESNPTTWKLAAMNMAIRGIDFNFGTKNADTLLDDQHPDLRADFVMANPPFNMKEWWSAKLENDVRWKYGTPPQGNANFAWMQHMIHHLASKGSMALLLANGSMSSNTNNEGEIRRNLIEADLVECMVALPGQLFTNTQIPACIWFLTKDKSGGDGKAHRKGEVLFIDARQIGYMKDRVLRDFTRENIAKIADTFQRQQAGGREMNIVRFDFGRDFVQRQGAVRCGVDGLRLDAAEYRRAAGFIEIVMRALADDILFAALAVAEQGDQVGLGAGGQEDRGFFARQLGSKALEFVNGRVVAIDVIPDRGGHHSFQHGAARAGDGITA